MKKVIICSVLAAVLLFPVATVAQDHAWTRDQEGNRVSTSGSAALPHGTQFRLAPSQLSLCSVSDSTLTRVDVTAAPGVDLLEGAGLDLRSLLAPAAFKANAALLSAKPGLDLTSPDAVRVLRRSDRPAADVSVAGDAANLRLQIFRKAGTCAASNVSADGVSQVTGAAVTASDCFGSCDCSVCGCVGSESCCDAGCDACWEYRDDAGLCGPA